MADVVIRLDTRELDRIIKQTPYTAQQIINRLAFQVEGRAKMLAPVDTGALRASIYTNTPGKSGFTGAISRTGKRGMRKGKTKKRGTSYGSVMEREVEELPMPSSDIGAVVGSPMSYAEYVERGTSRMGARPYLGPAVETIVYLFNAGQTWQELVK